MLLCFVKPAIKCKDFLAQLYLVASENDENQEIFSFGKHKGRTVEAVFAENPGYNNWIQNADFPLYTKKVLKEIKERMSAPKEKMSDEDKLQALQQKFNLR